MAYIGKVIYKVRRSIPETAISEKPDAHRMLIFYRGDLAVLLISLSLSAGKE
jgi:hypothetical protein